jgi:hypothetical protein
MIVRLVGVVSNVNYLEDARKHKPKIRRYCTWLKSKRKVHGTQFLK